MKIKMETADEGVRFTPAIIFLRPNQRFHAAKPVLWLKGSNPHRKIKRPVRLV
jgi:hypothetical protein